MSIKVMSLVWEKSAHKDTPLLLLLAIADYANDSGYAYPAIETLQKKIRVDSPRTVHYNLKKLVDSGELSIDKTKGGRANTHGFQINLDALKGAIAIAGFTKDKTLQSSAETLQPGVLNPAIAIAPEPSLTVIEPSLGANAPNVSVADSTKPEPQNPVSRTDEITVSKSHDLFCIPTDRPNERTLANVRGYTDAERLMVLEFTRLSGIKLTPSTAKTNLVSAREIITANGTLEDMKAAWKQSNHGNSWQVADLFSLKKTAVAIAGKRNQAGTMATEKKVIINGVECYLA